MSALVAYESSDEEEAVGSPIDRHQASEVRLRLAFLICLAMADCLGPRLQLKLRTLKL